MKELKSKMRLGTGTCKKHHHHKRCWPLWLVHLGGKGEDKWFIYQIFFNQLLWVIRYKRDWAVLYPTILNFSHC